MKRTSARVRVILIAGLVAGMLVFAGHAWANYQWTYTHGTTGRVESPASYTGTTYGWGLDFILNSTYAWVHYAVPSLTYSYDSVTRYKQWRVRYLRIKFYTSNADIRVTKIHLYDGNIRFKVIERPFATGWYGYNDLLVDLGQYWNIYRALGVTMEVDRGVENVTHNVKFYAVGARWE
jgi:hypothetical protein